MSPVHFVFRAKTEASDPTLSFIPYELHYMFETALLTLVGAEKIPHDFTGDNIFKKIRNKFNNAISNEKKKGAVNRSAENDMQQ